LKKLSKLIPYRLFLGKNKGLFMQIRRYKMILSTILCLGILFVLVFFAQAQDEATAEAELTPEATPMSEDEVLARGEYLAQIARCVGCHTPRLPEYETDGMASDLRITLSLSPNDALDFENYYMAGGRVFSLGPEGSLIAGNLTPDEATGIGAWTDEQLEMTLRLGVLPDGTMMHPLMPYRSYATWSAQDMQALIAYLRSIPAIENELEESLYLRDEFEGDPAEAFAALEVPETAPVDVLELGEYLVVDVMRCVGCHTPQNPETGRPDESLYLAGGQAFEGPWGIVYGSNITPHAETGIGTWTDEDIANVFHEGIRIDGRRLILMPWQDYSAINEDVITAVIAYLRSVEEVDNEIPLPAINDDFNQVVED
jgi:mono/diheme cytochrome c family protein